MINAMINSDLANELGEGHSIANEIFEQQMRFYEAKIRELLLEMRGMPGGSLLIISPVRTGQNIEIAPGEAASISVKWNYKYLGPDDRNVPLGWTAYDPRDLK
jgi:hypothetical protein